jgi:DNA-binding transcriptional MerR regulator
METHQKMLGTGEVARALGVPRWKLIYLIERDVVPDASFNVAGRRMFSEADVERIKQCLACLRVSMGIQQTS